MRMCPVNLLVFAEVYSVARLFVIFTSLLFVVVSLLVRLRCAFCNSILIWPFFLHILCAHVYTATSNFLYFTIMLISISFLMFFSWSVFTEGAACMADLDNSCHVGMYFEDMFNIFILLVTLSSFVLCKKAY